MAKSNLLEMHSYTDPALSFEFELIIPYIPGEGSRPGVNAGAQIQNNDVESAIARQYGANLSTASQLRIFAQQVTIPGKTIDEVVVQLTGGELVFAGLNKPAHDVTVVWPDRRDFVIYKAINRWYEYCRSHVTQHGHYKSEYAVTATVRMFDQRSYTVDQFKMYGFWPNAVPEVQYDATGSNVITHSVTFKCDWCELEFQEESSEFQRNVYRDHANSPV